MFCVNNSLRHKENFTKKKKIADMYIFQVTQRTYEHINSTGSYETLHSTRHYGPMVFCFAYYRNIDGIVVHLIKEARYVLKWFARFMILLICENDSYG